MKAPVAAASMPTVFANSDTLALLVFTVAGKVFSFPVANVVRIIEMVTITPLPNAPDTIQGIINMQGKVVPIIDLARRFGLPEQAYGLHTPIILVDMTGDGQMLGLVVETVEDVLHVPSQNLEITESFVPLELGGQLAAQTTHMTGVAKVDRRMVLVLNIRALLTKIEQAELMQALTSDDVALKVE